MKLELSAYCVPNFFAYWFRFLQVITD